MEPPNSFQAYEKDLLKDRNSSYRGTARIPLGALSFQRRKSRSDLASNIERMKEIFIGSQCQRLDPANKIPVLISQQSLDTITRLSNITLKQLVENTQEDLPLLEMSPNIYLECLDGESRIEAAKEVLPRDDAWWVVDLYIDGRSVSSIPQALGC